MSVDIPNPKHFEIDADYQSVFADGLILKVEDNDTVKLIFYENTYKFNPEFGYDKDQKVSRLKFEVRMSLTTLSKLSMIAFDATYSGMIVDSVKIRTMNKLSPNTIKTIDNLSNETFKTVFDTDNPTKYADNFSDLFQSATERLLKDDAKKDEKSE